MEGSGTTFRGSVVTRTVTPVAVPLIKKGARLPRVFSDVISVLGLTVREMAVQPVGAMVVRNERYAAISGSIPLHGQLGLLYPCRST